ncbi:unnamed protein product [Allacma fusca]|uniref:Uncharacterized protein n=1 Tax=Allacma fusca TaxID=39272 RepID=A0A8J2LGZ6_9HEXA|nr:unnamed protein product [Allacma fusca]
MKSGVTLIFAKKFLIWNDITKKTEGSMGKTALSCFQGLGRYSSVVVLPTCSYLIKSDLYVQLRLREKILLIIIREIILNTITLTNSNNPPTSLLKRITRRLRIIMDIPESLVAMNKRLSEKAQLIERQNEELLSKLLNAKMELESMNRALMRIEANCLEADGILNAGKQFTPSLNMLPSLNLPPHFTSEEIMRNDPDNSSYANSSQNMADELSHTDEATSTTECEDELSPDTETDDSLSSVDDRYTHFVKGKCNVMKLDH